MSGISRRGRPDPRRVEQPAHEVPRPRRARHDARAPGRRSPPMSRTPRPDPRTPRASCAGARARPYPRHPASSRALTEPGSPP